MLRHPKSQSKHESRSAETEGRTASRRLLRVGLTMFGVSSTLWVVTLGVVTIGWNKNPGPIAEVLTLTLTVLLWPAATLGLLALLCWLIITIAERIRQSRQ